MRRRESNTYQKTKKIRAGAFGAKNKKTSL
jgi:hypothetical protein